MIQTGALPEDVDKQGYYDMMKILRAKPADERPVDPAIAFKKMLNIQSQQYRR
ncbi:hypothetical protein [Secundilactobacillus pentosiphilus]|uniref:hypothetical protein n=1 Tax=Secundilactobacillus pentosiphilus TaxID=1714682 RepID=UPI001CDA69EF|nr:hypothetical protein [Secundilactobacillus pentosiphilus]